MYCISYRGSVCAAGSNCLLFGDKIANATEETEESKRWMDGWMEEEDDDVQEKFCKHQQQQQQHDLLIELSIFFSIVLLLIAL